MLLPKAIRYNQRGVSVGAAVAEGSFSDPCFRKPIRKSDEHKGFKCCRCATLAGSEMRLKFILEGTPAARCLYAYSPRCKRVATHVMKSECLLKWTELAHCTFVRHHTSGSTS